MELVLFLFALFPSVFATPSINDVPLHRRQAVGGIVNTTSGQVQGTASDLRPDVSAYLGVPFGEPPVGDLRFAAPVAAKASSSVINATAFGPDCPSNHIPTSEAPVAGPAGQKILIALAQTGDPLSEDCLTLNIWTKPQTGETKKAVLFWIFGGGFSIGNTACPIYDGAILADENDVVVVSVNYRVNIFGFSGAPGTTTNPGLLDQRLGLEWVRDNIEAFGGDPSRITIFGQSAGGASVDYMSYAYVEDPIAHAYIAHSGVANSLVGAGTTNESAAATWYKASENLGCGGAEAGEATVACVRTKSTADILAAIEPLQTTAIMSGFGPLADGITVPNDIPTKGAAGDFAKLPFMTGNADDEAGFFAILVLAYTSFTAAEVNLIPITILQPILDLATLIGFTCAAGQAASYRTDAGVPAWRYRYYGGNYTNTFVTEIGSAYHCADLPIIFGTAASVTGIADSDSEAEMAAYMRGAWAAFAKDPANGLATLGWPKYNDLLPSEIQLALGDQTTASYIFNERTDFLCPAVTALTGALTSSSSLNISGIFSDLIGMASGNSSNPLLSTIYGLSSTAANTSDPVVSLIESLGSLFNITLPSLTSLSEVATSTPGASGIGEPALDETTSSAKSFNVGYGMAVMVAIIGAFTMLY